MWKSLSNSHSFKLIKRYDILQREEASIIVKYREDLNKPFLTLQKSVYEIEQINQKLKKEFKILDLQLNKSMEDLNNEPEINS